jgi:TRAP-type C4-dicarboxylate transport system substrate-binding protein
MTYHTRRTLLLGGLAGVSLASTAFRAAGQSSSTIRIAYNLPKDHATGVYFEALAREVEKRTATTSLKIKAQTFPNGQLYNDTQLPDAVGTGGVEIGQMNIGFMNNPDADPLRIWGLPFLYRSWEALWATEDNPVFREAFNRQFAKFNMHMLGWVQYGTVEFYASKPIRLPADMKGLRMRAFGVDTSVLIRDLGGSPISLSSQEMYQAVQRGTIDGFITGPTSVYSRKLYEVVKHGTDIGISYLSFMATANMSWWNTLPADTKAAVTAASAEAQRVARLRAKDDDRTAKEQLKQKGVTTPKLTPEQRQLWVVAAKGLYDTYLAKAGATGAELLRLVDASNKQFPA